MHNIQDYFQKFKSKLQLEQVFNIIVLTIIFFVVATSLFISLRSVNVEQYNQIKQLSYQQSYPDTQHMAEMLLMKDKISKIEFNRLMQAHHFESSKVKTYPAQDAEYISK